MESAESDPCGGCASPGAEDLKEINKQGISNQRQTATAMKRAVSRTAIMPAITQRVTSKD